MVQDIWGIFGRPEVNLFASENNTHCHLFLKGQGRVGPQLAQLPPLCFSPNCPDPAGNQENQGTEAQSSVRGPALEEPALVCRAVLAAHCSPVANGTIWHPQPKLWALHIWPLDGSLRTFPREC